MNFRNILKDRKDLTDQICCA